MEVVSYPMFELSTIVEILRKARKAGRTINKQILANASTQTGKGSTKSGVFNQKLAAFRHFNLIESEGSQITFTPLAEKITQNNKSALKIAFLAPKTYKEMHTLMEKNINVPLNILEDIAQHQMGITEVGKTLFVKNFIKSAIYSEMGRYSLGTRDEVIIYEENQQDLTSPLEQETPTQQLQQQEIILETPSQKAELKTSKGKAVIIVPEELDEEDKQKLKAQIDLF